MRSAMVAAAGASLLLGAPGHAQDVPGIEICTVEKTMERRTSCLQSNVNFLMAQLTRAMVDSQRRIDEASRRADEASRKLDALTATVAALQKTIDQLQAEKAKAEPRKDGK